MDLGAGRSYLLLGPGQLEEFLTTPGNRFEVRFADESVYTIRESTRIDLTLRALDSINNFKHRNVELMIIRRPRNHSMKYQILMGRDLIDKFRIDVYRARKAMIQNITLHDAPQEDKDRFPNNSDRLNYLATLVSPCRLVGMPRRIIEDITTNEDNSESDDEPLTADDAAQIINQLQNPPEPAEIQISIQNPDNDAPWGRCYVKIPWKGHHRPTLNFKSVWIRDTLTMKRLNETDKYLYNEEVRKLTECGFAAPPETTGQPVRHYIPVRPVIKVGRETTKCRLCLDATALNKFTEQGALLSKPLLDCLLEFRAAKFVAIYDLERAFWQVKFHDDEIGWFSTIINSKPLQFRRLIFGANFSPSALEHSLRVVLGRGSEILKSSPPQHHDEPRRPQSLRNVFNYVDDFCHVENQSSETLLIEAEWTRWLLSKFGFKSAKFVTNVKTTTTDEADHKYLGYNWNASQDYLNTRLPDLPGRPPSMRVKDIVSLLAKFYDPLGLELKTQLKGRTIVRAIFTLHQGKEVWTQNVTDTTIMTLLDDWRKDVTSSRPAVPRRVVVQHLNLFVDASQKSWVYELRDKDMALVYSRGGLTGTKWTIPRSELVALHRAIKDLPHFLRTFSETEGVTVYTDSACTLHRLRQQTKLPKFEARRISEILSLLAEMGEKVQVVHIPGDLNPADYPSRPELNTPRPTLDANLILSHAASRNTLRFQTGMQFEDEVGLMTLRRRKETTTKPNPVEPETHPENLEATETTGETQEPEPEDSNPETTERVMKERIVRLRESQEKHKVELNEFRTIDQWDLIRENDRIIIPKQDHELINATMTRIHNQAHFGTAATRAAIRGNYTWSGMHKDIKSFVSACDICQRSRTRRCLRTTAGEALAYEDIENIPMLSIVGIDIAVIDSIEIGQPSCILTATCLLSKWIRAEALETQCADDVVSALEKMFFRSVFPKVLVTDNAPSFKGKKLRRFSIKHGIHLCHLPPYASAYGGWIERSHQVVLAGLRTLVNTDASRSWGEHLQEACHLGNMRDYDPESGDGLSPMTVVFYGCEPADPELPDEEQEKLLEKAKLLHLSSTNGSPLTEYRERMRKKRSRQLKQFEYLFNKRRSDAHQRMQGIAKDRSDDFPVGSTVRVYRPTLSKVRNRWSEPRRVTQKPTDATRIVTRADGTTTLEWVANLSKVPS